MFRKKTDTPNLYLINDKNVARRAEAQKRINRTVVSYFAIKVAVCAAGIIATHIISKKMDKAEAAETSED